MKLVFIDFTIIISNFAIDKSDDENLRHKVGRYNVSQKSHKAVHLTFITPYGLKQNKYQYVVQNVITAEELFKE